MSVGKSGNKVLKTSAKQDLETASRTHILYAGPAISQIRAHKFEVIIAAVALLCYSVATVFAARLTTHFLEDSLRGSGLTVQVLSVPTVLTSLVMLLSLAAVIYVLFCLARPIRKRIVALRLTLLGLWALLTVFVTSLGLGLLARILFAESPARFDLARTGIDHASGLIGVLITTLFFVFLASCLREEKLTFKGFGVSFTVLFTWIAAVYIIKFVVFLALDGLWPLLFGASALELAGILFALLLAILSTLATLWYTALALALVERAHKKSAKKDSDSSTFDSDTQETEDVSNIAGDTK